MLGSVHATASARAATTGIGPLSICMISDDFVPAATGVGTHVQIVSKHLAALGHRVTVVTTRRPGEPGSENWHGVHVARMPTVKVAGFYQAVPGRSRLASILAQAAPDVVHHHYLGLMMWRAVALCERLRLPQVYTYHMTEDHLTQPWPLRPLRRLVARGIVRVANRIDLVISVSARLAATLPAKGIDAPIETLSNPVEFPAVAPASASPGPPRNGFVALFAGRLNPEKNVALLLQAFALFAPRTPECRLWIAGIGSQRSALEALAARLGVAARVEFLGHLRREDLALRYRDCDAFVLPSLVETQGLVAMEAMRFAKPVVVADSVISAPELVAEGVNGYIFDHRDPQALADRLQDLAASPALRASMGRAGLQRTRDWLPEAVVPQLEALYRRALASSRHRRLAEQERR